MLDIFHDDAFGVVALTDAVNKIPFVPGRLGQLGLFTATAIASTTVVIDEKDGVLTLIAPSPRGGPGTTLDKAKGVVRTLSVPHFEVNDAVMAEEVQGVRAWGTENQLQMVMGKVAERLSEHGSSFAATEEYARIGAIKGIVTYADGTSLNLFTEFGVAQETEVDFELDENTGSAASGELRQKCAAVCRTIANNLGATPYTGVMAEASDEFFDALLQHPEVVDSYKGTSMASVLREGYVLPNGNKIFGAFEFGGIVWENYRGKVGDQRFIDADKAHIFPLGVPGLFRTVYSPADYVETVNTLGQRLYAKQYDMPNGKGIHLDTQMNALQYCVRPKTLIKGKRA